MHSFEVAFVFSGMQFVICIWFTFGKSLKIYSVYKTNCKNSIFQTILNWGLILGLMIELNQKSEYGTKYRRLLNLKSIHCPRTITIKSNKVLAFDAWIDSNTILITVVPLDVNRLNLLIIKCKPSIYIIIVTSIRWHILNEFFKIPYKPVGFDNISTNILRRVVCWLWVGILRSASFDSL